MTTAALPVCRVCQQDFTPDDPTRRGPKPNLCAACTDRYRNPPEQQTLGLCRMCQEPAFTGETGKRLPWQASTFCSDCFVIYRKVYLQGAKRKERAAR